ncbi:hypothetical protein SAMN05892883_2796 [Jatrophihabitans sp. GAS493]|nr:hypothetical protein SAMN05892883_2796 [Jatrophihabitans sp. GAS493]
MDLTLLAQVDRGPVDAPVFPRLWARVFIFDRTVLYVGEQSRVAHLAAKPYGDFNLAPIRALLNEQTVTAYTNDAPGRRVFVTILQATFYLEARRARRARRKAHKAS